MMAMGQRSHRDFEITEGEPGCQYDVWVGIHGAIKYQLQVTLAANSAKLLKI